jgi:hypothetical protein
MPREKSSVTVPLKEGFEETHARLARIVDPLVRNFTATNVLKTINSKVERVVRW